MQNKKTNRQHSKIRIIGGKWRSRSIEFTVLPEMRPTPNRIRETLFNWLAPYIIDASCLDPFAGSGALGFEALSRGAKSVVMIDQNPDIVTDLKKTAQVLQAENAIQFFCANFPANFSALLKTQKFTMVFLDPPFKKNLIQHCAQWLEQQGCLAPNALIYLEAEKELKELCLPENWEIIRSKVAGNVGYHLAKRV